MKHVYLLALAGMLLAGCDSGGQKGTGAVADVADGAAPADSFDIRIAPFAPQELDPGSDPKKLAEFAWAEFFALNWQSSYHKNHRRDYPDTTWQYSQPGSDPTLAVWETYAHRTELQPFNGKLQPFDSAPVYSFGTTIPLYPGVPQDSAKAYFTRFDNIDENNEIGSCNMYAHADSVNGQPNPNKRMVLYQAKVNRDEYEYIYNTYPSHRSLSRARLRTKRGIAKDNAYFTTPAGRPGRTNCDCPPGDSVICLPCGGSRMPSGGQRTGAMEIKTAWRQLTPQDNRAEFIVRKGLYYRQLKGKTYYDNADFALIAIHIIHKTQNYPEFVFATFEHQSVRRKDQGYRYVLLDNNGNEIPGSAGIPRVKPVMALTDRVTQAAHQKLSRLNAKSVLLNYRLVGVQGTPTNDSTTANFFLANYVVESDQTLADFHGSSIDTPNNRKSNVLLVSKGQLVSMGGCQGCHGVAQRRLGTDFSFLLDSLGKPVQAPDVDETQRQKLLRYIRATRQPAAKR